MDFIKKNWGLVTAGAVTLVLAIYVLMRILGLGGQYAESSKALEEQQGFFSKAEQSRLKLKAEPGRELENLVLAQQNFSKAEGYYNDLRQFLSQSSTITYTVPATQTEALRLLSEKIGQMHEFTIKNEMMVANLGNEYTAILNTGSLNNSEFGPLFRQLRIFEYLLERIAEAGIKTVDLVKWPMGFATRDEDIYTMTPIVLVMIADIPPLQSFLNGMMNDKNMMFTVKSVTFNAPDAIFPALANHRGIRDSRAMEEDAAMDMGGGAAPARSGFTGRPGRQTPPAPRRLAPAAGPGLNFPGMDMPAAGSQSSRLIVLPPKRQDFIVYQPKQVKMEVRLNLHEFKKIDEQP